MAFLNVDESYVTIERLITVAKTGSKNTSTDVQQMK
jgi:hypothetical protein